MPDWRTSSVRTTATMSGGRDIVQVPFVPSLLEDHGHGSLLARFMTALTYMINKDVLETVNHSAMDVHHEPDSVPFSQSRSLSIKQLMLSSFST
jgi:hypothetical protein